VEDRARFEALYRAHAGAVRTYVCRRSNAAMADDVVADVFVVAWRRLDDVPDSPLPWLLGVARRLLANRRRGEARAAALHARIAANETTPSESSSASESARTVLIALEGLSERDREVLLLIGWEGLQPAEAARALGLRPNTFAARMYRARRRFARALAASSEHTGRTQPSTGAEVIR
jgi:RNA polymerase sigma-70 factor (ECF subfamily)